MEFNFFDSSSIISPPEVIFSFLGINFTDTVLASVLLTILFFIFLAFITYKLDLKNRRGFIAEMVYEVPLFLGRLALGDKAKKHIAFIATLLFYIFFANIIGFFPIPFISSSFELVGIKAPTSDLNATAALSLISISYITFHSIKSKGIVNYFKSFLEPLPFLLPLNIIGEVAKPFSLAMRLFGNIFSGALIMNLAYKYLPYLFPAFLHLYFDLFAGAIQSIIFVSLTTVYMSFAIDD